MSIDLSKVLKRLGALALVGAVTFAFQAKADDYPSKQIQILVGFNAGGGVDSTIRIVAKYAKKHFGADAVVVNKPGGGGSISWNSLTHAKADGYTLAGGVIPNMIYQPAVRGADSPGYQTEDLIQIGMISRIPTAIYVSQNSKYKTLTDLIADAKARPGKLSIGVIGPNTVTDGFRVMFEEATGTNFQRVVFKGGAPLSKQVIGGHIDAMVSNAMYAVSKRDTLRPLGVASPKPFSLADDVPTFEATGYPLEDYVWRGILAPKDTPADRVEHLRAGLKAMSEDPAFLKDMNKAGILVDYVSPKDTEVFIEKFLKERKSVIAAFREAAK